MKRINLIMLIMVLLVLAVSLTAKPVLPKDGNGISMQYGKSFACKIVSPAADTVGVAVTVPANTYQAVIVPLVGGAGIRSASDSEYAQLPVNVICDVPTLNVSTFYVRRAATGTATVVYIIWKKM